jgi:flagellar basal-body rod protein FlgF
MLRGLYTAAAGMMTIQERTDMTANNLANVDTVGFKADLLRFVSAPAIHTWRLDDPTHLDDDGNRAPEYLGLTNTGTMDTEVWRDFDQGQLVHTARDLDLAIVGDGFFRVIDDAGQELYTRDGQFRQRADGLLVDNHGRRVQGTAGDVALGSGNDVRVNRSGEVYVDGGLAANLDLAYFTDPQQQLSKIGGNVWESSIAPDGVGISEVRSGYIERSNVDALRCITELIRELRHYQASEKVVLAADETMQIAANQIGRMPQ